ncbi:MAG: hypothetical protein K8T25_16955 [Planctomycetia bacterium]|nr:hypothetical protein [Planctomycetia bacterium]
MKTTYCFLLALIILSLVVFSTAASADDKPVKLSNQWKGSVADAALADGAPTFIATAKEFDALWTKWKLADKPAIDFSKEIVVLATSPGSHLSLSCTLSDAGNLNVIGMATLDFGEGFRYVIGTVSRDGVKTVQGKELPKE